MVKVLAAGCCALALAACDSPGAIPAGSVSPASGAAGSPAGALRVHLDLLIGEHVFAVAKLAVAAAAGRQDEYRSYAGMLAANGGDVEALMRSALGETSGSRFGDAWTEQNNFLVDYLVAVVTHDQAASTNAASNLSGYYVPDAASALGSGLSMSSDAAGRLVAAHATALKTIIDDAVSGSAAQLYADIGMARVQAVSFADAVAVQVAHDYADRYPGDPLESPSTQRANLNSLMQQQGYLMTMASDAAVAGVNAQVTAAATALTENADQLAALYGGRVWKDEVPLLSTYAQSGGAAARQSFLGAAPASLTQALTALLQVVDDQRSKQFGTVATDDRAMAYQLSIAADGVSTSSSPSS
jgi:hypothetical protein